MDETSEVYYIYFDDCVENSIVEAMSNEQLVYFLEMHSDRKWKILSRRMDHDGFSYVTLKRKWSRREPVEWRIIDSYWPATHLNYDMDYEWRNYLFNTLIKPALEKHMK